MRSSLAPLRGRDFRLLFAGRVTSLLGTAVAPVALAFAVLDISGSKTELGLVLAARQVPLITFLLVGGLFADRLRRNEVIVAADLVSGLSQAIVAVLLITGSAEIWHLAALAAVNGSATAFFLPASSGIIPQTVPPPLLQPANALLGLGLNSAQIGGAALAGFLVAAFGAGTAIAVDALTYFAGAALIALMRIPANVGAGERYLVQDLRRGWNEFRRRTWLWVIVGQFSLINAVKWGGLFVLAPIVMRDHFDGPRDYGLL